MPVGPPPTHARTHARSRSLPQTNTERLHSITDRHPGGGEGGEWREEEAENGKKRKEIKEIRKTNTGESKRRYLIERGFKKIRRIQRRQWPSKCSGGGARERWLSCRARRPPEGRSRVCRRGRRRSAGRQGTRDGARSHPSPACQDAHAQAHMSNSCALSESSFPLAFTLYLGTRAASALGAPALPN